MYPFSFLFWKIYQITLSKMQVDDATTHLNKVSRQFSGPNGKIRIGVCRTNYRFASAKFQNAWELCLKKSFREANEKEKIGTKAVMDCEKAWAKGGPIQKSPLILYNLNVSKMSGIILLLVQKLSP